MFASKRLQKLIGKYAPQSERLAETIKVSTESQQQLQQHCGSSNAELETDQEETLRYYRSFVLVDQVGSSRHLDRNESVNLAW